MNWWVAPAVVSSAIVIERFGKNTDQDPFPLGSVVRLFTWGLTAWFMEQEAQQLSDLGQFRVVCRKGSESGGVYSSRRDADCAAQNIADHEDTICMVIDQWGHGHQVMRGSGRCGQRDPYPTSVPRFHPHPMHPRSRERFLRNEYSYW